MDLCALRLVRAAELVAAGVEEILTYDALPAEHWRGIRQQPARAHPARDPAAHACRGRVPRRPIRAQPRGREAMSHRRHGLVDAEISEHELLKDHRVSQGQASLVKPKVRKILDTTQLWLFEMSAQGV
jgi:hypothetical protein